ncbi:hypothetical protein FXO38_00871 [Capsicum annuum]|nr:hypothetical protein FXO38_00871 [Capsicum annuum]
MILSPDPDQTLGSRLRIRSQVTNGVQSWELSHRSRSESGVKSPIEVGSAFESSVSSWAEGKDLELGSSWDPTQDLTSDAGPSPGLHFRLLTLNPDSSTPNYFTLGPTLDLNP